MSAGIQLAVMGISLVCAALFGRMLIPVLRKNKTGKFDMYIGDRFRKDGSEPSGGGAVLLAGAAVGSCLGAAGSFWTALWGLIYLGLLTALGLGEDLHRDKTGGIGLRPAWRMAVKIMASAVLIVSLESRGVTAREILLPFRWGYIDLGRAYVPLTAVMLALMITLTEQHDAHKGISDTGIDGLCGFSSGIGLLGLMTCFSAVSRTPGAALWTACGAGLCMGFIVWGMSPGKIYLGSSGAMCLGGIYCLALMTSGLHLAVWLCMTAMILDGIAAGLQRTVFRLTKKLLLKGASLREHLRAGGMTDFGIMGLFALTQVIGAAAAIAFTVYEGRLTV